MCAYFHPLIVYATRVVILLITHGDPYPPPLRSSRDRVPTFFGKLACVAARCSPSSVPFPPQPPPERSLLCSAGSQVVRRSVTSPTRACPHCGLWPSRTGLPQQAKACRRSPGSRACCFISVRGL